MRDLYNGFHVLGIVQEDGILGSDGENHAVRKRDENGSILCHFSEFILDRATLDHDSRAMETRQTGNRRSFQI